MIDNVWQISMVSSNSAWVNFTRHIWDLLAEKEFDSILTNRSKFSAGLDWILSRDYKTARIDQIRGNLVFLDKDEYVRFLLKWS